LMKKSVAPGDTIRAYRDLTADAKAKRKSHVQLKWSSKFRELMKRQPCWLQ